jgi:hypothetical protein
VLVASTACGALGVPGGVSRVVPHARQARCSDLWGVAGLLISEGKKIADPLSNAPINQSGAPVFWPDAVSPAQFADNVNDGKRTDRDQNKHRKLVVHGHSCHLQLNRGAVRRLSPRAPELNAKIFCNEIAEFAVKPRSKCGRDCSTIYLNAKCLSEKRVGQRRLQTVVRAIYEGDLTLAIRSNVWE